MPSQEEKALARYEALKEIIKKSVNGATGTYLFAYMFDQYGILERTTSRYLRYLKTLKYVDIEGDLVKWKDQQN